ncbi:MAG: hypothetical protein ABFD86_09110 [Bryobacteraceae bacterium]
MEPTLALLILILVALALYLMHSAARHRADSAVKRALIEKLASAHDLAEFSSTDAGRAFIQGLSSNVTNPLHTLLEAIRTSLLLGFPGLALLVSKMVVSRLPPQAVVFGIILIALGVAVLISAAISYALARKWGLVDKTN